MFPTVIANFSIISVVIQHQTRIHILNFWNIDHATDQVQTL